MDLGTTKHPHLEALRAMYHKCKEHAHGMEGYLHTIFHDPHNHAKIFDIVKNLIKLEMSLTEIDIEELKNLKNVVNENLELFNKYVKIHALDELKKDIDPLSKE